MVFLDPEPQQPQELDEVEYDTIPGIVNSWSCFSSATNRFNLLPLLFGVENE